MKTILKADNMSLQLPVDYTKIKTAEKKKVRLQYIERQRGLCHYCNGPLTDDAPQYIKVKKINWKLFPKGFLNNPIHLQHNHTTGMTEGAVHSYCNAVMWQYDGR